jgi:hypothetical protein
MGMDITYILPTLMLTNRAYIIKTNMDNSNIQLEYYNTTQNTLQIVHHISGECHKFNQSLASSCVNIRIITIILQKSGAKRARSGS